MFFFSFSFLFHARANVGLDHEFTTFPWSHFWKGNPLTIVSLYTEAWKMTQEGQTKRMLYGFKVILFFFLMVADHVKLSWSWIHNIFLEPMSQRKALHLGLFIPKLRPTDQTPPTASSAHLNLQKIISTQSVVDYCSTFLHCLEFTADV